MFSRRKFLQTNLGGLALTLPAADKLRAVLPQVNQASTPGTEIERDYWNDWPNYLTSKTNEARARRLAELRAMRTEADVQARIEKIRSAIWDLIGGEFEKTPLNPQTVGAIDRGAYQIEKVIFESQPEIFVTANLYLPKKRPGPHPGVILPLGHAEEGKAHRSYQYVSQTLARLGYVVIAFDPFGQGERLQYLDPRTGKGHYGPTGSHTEAGRPMLLFGSQFEQYRTWDCIRAVDYLLTRPEVDAQRIGCTGQSGGGTMTMYVAALEPRVKAAVVSDGNSENVAGPDYAPPGAVDDAEQNIVGSLAENIDRGDLLLAFAPKPLMILYSTTDSGFTYSPTYVKGTHEVYAELQSAYKLMGADDKAGLFGSPLPHDYDYFNRQHVYSWFNRWLGREDWGTEEAAFDESPPGALNCTTTGQVLTSLGGRSVVQLNSDRLAQLAPAASGSPAEAADVRATLTKLLALPAERTSLRARTISSNTRKNQVIEQFWFYSEPGVRVPGWLLKPADGHSPFPAVIYVSERNSNEVAYETSEIGKLTEAGYAVCAIDLRGLGDSLPHSPAAGPAYYRGMPLRERYAWACFTLGKCALGQRVWDLLRCLDYLHSRPDVDHSHLRGLGERGAALAILMAGVLDQRLGSILLDSPIATYASLVKSQAYSLDLSWFLFDVLKHFDLPDLAACRAPRTFWLLNATNSQSEPLPESEIAPLYKRPLASFKPAGGEIRLIVRPEQEKAIVFKNWLQTT